MREKGVKGTGHSAADRPLAQCIGRAEAASAALLAALVVCFDASLFAGLGSLMSRNPDWLLHYANHAFLRRALLEHGQVPLWSPYFGGGFPVYAHPEFPLFNPLSLFTVFLGEIAGTKLIALFMHVSGTLGMFWFCGRVLRMHTLGAVFSAALFALNGWTPGRLLSGNLNELYYLWTPILVACFYRAGRDRGRYLFAGAVLVAVVLLDGKLVGPVLAFFLLLVALVRTVRRDENRRLRADLRPLRYVLIMAGAAALLAAVKVIPGCLLLGLHRDPFHASLLMKTRVYSAATIGGHPFGALMRFLAAPVTPGTPQEAVSLYIGWLPMLLAAVGLALDLRRMWRWAVLWVVALVLAMGPHSPVDLFRLVRAVPPFGAMSFPAKYFNFFLPFIIALMAGSMFSVLDRKRWLRAALVPAILVCLWATWPLFWRNRVVLERLFDEPAPAETRGEFCQIKMSGISRNKRNAYLPLKRNMGLINWYSYVRWQENAQPRFYVDPAGRAEVNPSYKGEAFIAHGKGRARVLALAPNRIVVSVNADEPCVLVVNQNYHPGWRCTPGRPSPTDGLLSVPLHSAGAEVVAFRFVPADFCIGLGASVMSLGVFGWVCFGRRPRQPQRVSPATPGPPAA